MIERVKRWLAGCGVDRESRVGKLERPHARRPRNLHFFFLFAFCLSIVVSDRAEKKENTQRESHMKVERTSTKNRSKIDRKSTKIDEKSMKIRSWVVLGAQGRFGDAPGHAQDGSEKPNSRPRADLGAPRASQEQPGVVQKRPMAGPETHLGRTGTLPERVRHIEPRQTRSRNDFATFLRRQAKARSLKFVRPRSVS